MSETFKLPLRVKRGRELLLVLPALLLYAALGAAGLYYVQSLHPQNNWPPFLVPAVIVGCNIVVAYVILYLVQPATIDINDKTIEVTPLPLVGRAFCKPANYPVKDLGAVELDMTQGKYSACHVVFRDRFGKRTLSFFWPQQKTAENFVRELGGALNLRVRIERGQR